MVVGGIDAPEFIVKVVRVNWELFNVLRQSRHLPPRGDCWKCASGCGIP